MDIGSIFLIFALFILVVLFIARPFFEQKSTAVTREEHDISALLAERDRVITALQELDFDFALKKIPEEDYPAQRAGLLERGAAILQALDELAPQKAKSSTEARIESAVAARRAELAKDRQPAGKNGGHIDDDLEALIAARKRTRQETASGFCPQCGGPVSKSDKFCSRCGATL